VQKVRWSTYLQSNQLTLATRSVTSANFFDRAGRQSSTRITKSLPFAEIRATLIGRKLIKEPRRMQLEIPEGAHVHIVIARAALAKACGGLDSGAGAAILALPGEAGAARTAPRFGRLLLRGSLGMMLLAGSFAAGQHFGSFPRAPELARTAAALPRLAPTAEQRAIPDPPQPPEAPAQTAGEVTANFQKRFQQPPTVIAPPGQSGVPETRGRNPFGLEN
jgi:hypothetical protein